MGCYFIIQILVIHANTFSVNASMQIIDIIVDNFAQKAFNVLTNHCNCIWTWSVCWYVFQKLLKDVNEVVY